MAGRPQAALVVDDIARAGHGAHAAGETLIRVDKGAVFRNDDGSGRAGALAQTAADAASQFYNCADTIGHADRLKRTGLSAGAAGYTIFLINLRITLATHFIASPTRFILTLL